MHANTHTYSHSLVWSFYTFVHTLTHTHKSHTFCCTRTLCSVAERSWVEMSEALSVTHTSMIQSLEVTMSWLLEGVSTLHSVWSLSVLPLVVPAHLHNVFCNASGLCHIIILCILYIRHVIVSDFHITIIADFCKSCFKHLKCKKVIIKNTFSINILLDISNFYKHSVVHVSRMSNRAYTLKMFSCMHSLSISLRYRNYACHYVSLHSAVSLCFKL